MTVSIGMPVYNGEKYIRDALDSLLGQSYKDFELIISDNASTDSTEKICRQYAWKDARVKYFRQPKNLGAAANFRFVLDQANGAYFMWAACDDKWSPDWLERMREALGNVDVGMVFGQLIHIDAQDRLMAHPANGVNFHFGRCESALWRRVRFYLAYEGMGKANNIYSMYKNELLKPLDAMWSDLISDRLIYDYTIVYGCLQYGKLKQLGQATLFKRVHDLNEGAACDAKPKGVIGLARRVGWVIWPFPPMLFTDYLRHSTFVEKVILWLLFPVKLLVAYHFVFKRIASRLLRNWP